MLCLEIQPKTPPSTLTHLPLLAICGDQSGVGGRAWFDAGCQHLFVCLEGLLWLAPLVACTDDGVVGAHLGLNALCKGRVLGQQRSRNGPTLCD